MSIESIIVEIRAAEGGEDARLLIIEQFNIYTKYMSRRKLKHEILEQRPNILTFRVKGNGAVRAFHNEGGGMRWQRVPPTERKGRVHTSTVTVAVLREPTQAEVRIDPRDLDYKTCRGSGAGGQHRNTTDSAVQLTHKPSGIMVRVESERSQHQNKESALSLLRARLLEQAQARTEGNRNAKRRKQVGGGSRGDKRRTHQVQNGQVTDHVTGKRMPLRKYLKGQVEDLWR